MYRINVDGINNYIETKIPYGFYSHKLHVYDYTDGSKRIVIWGLGKLNSALPLQLSYTFW
jgi:hypothetical protein